MVSMASDIDSTPLDFEDLTAKLDRETKIADGAEHLLKLLANDPTQTNNAALVRQVEKQLSAATENIKKLERLVSQARRASSSSRGECMLHLDALRGYVVEPQLLGPLSQPQKTRPPSQLMQDRLNSQQCLQRHRQRSSPTQVQPTREDPPKALELLLPHMDAILPSLRYPRAASRAPLNGLLPHRCPCFATSRLRIFQKRIVEPSPIMLLASSRLCGKAPRSMAAPLEPSPDSSSPHRVQKQVLGPHILGLLARITGPGAKLAPLQVDRLTA